MATGGEDIVADLLSVPFSIRPFNEKMDIVKNGRPTPEHLELSQPAKAGYVRHFQASNWKRYTWLTGSVRHKRLYCWECLLFVGTDNGAWNLKGYENLSCLTKAAQRHQNTAGHLKATIAMKTFEVTRIDMQLDEQRRREITIHNEKVKKNREILKRLIQCVIFLGKHELPFGHDEGRESANRGNYLELLSFLAEYDPDLHYHLSTSNVFIGASIQKSLISAVADVMGETIKEEIRKAPFVAVMLDETSDVSNTEQLSLVLRFVTDSVVKERFIKFEDVTGNKRAEDVAALILGFLEEYECMDKVVAQCYDGAAIMASGLNEVQAKVKEKIPQALFIHCYAHALNLVLSQGVSKIRECKIFFSHLSGLPAFFSRSPKLMQLLDELCQKQLPHMAPTRQNFASRLVCTVFEKKDALKDLFVYIVDHHDEFEDAAIQSADGYISHLDNFEFCFLLSAFNEMFARADVLFAILQNNSFDMQFCMARVDEFCICIEGQRKHFDQIYDETLQNIGLPTGRRRAHGDSHSHYKKLHDDIIDNILNQVQNRFKDHEKLEFLSLLDPQKFTSFKTTFPETAFSSLTDSYGQHFDLPRLKIELSVVYSMEDFQEKNPSDLLLFLQRQGLCDSMHQLYVLTCLVLTIPVTMASVETKCSTLKRIKTYARNTTGQSRLSALASIAIEKQILLDLKTSDLLYDRVIEKFIQKDRRMDLIFV